MKSSASPPFPEPQIQILQGIPGARSASGIVVIIDVLRAFTSAAFAFYRGLSQLYLVSSATESFAWRTRDPQVLLAGEDGGKKIEGFDLGNSPEEFNHLDLSGRTLVLRTTSGTQGVVNATGAQQIFLGSLVTAKATAQLIRHRLQKVPHDFSAALQVNLVAMGGPGHDGEEDFVCAEYLRSLILNRPGPTEEDIKKRVRGSTSGRNALDPHCDLISQEDLERALELDRFAFALEVRRAQGLYQVEKLT